MTTKEILTKQLQEKLASKLASKKEEVAKKMFESQDSIDSDMPISESEQILNEGLFKSIIHHATQAVKHSISSAGHKLISGAKKHVSNVKKKIEHASQKHHEAGEHLSMTSHAHNLHKMSQHEAKVHLSKHGELRSSHTYTNSAGHKATEHHVVTNGVHHVIHTNHATGKTYVHTFAKGHDIEKRSLNTKHAAQKTSQA